MRLRVERRRDSVRREDDRPLLGLVEVVDRRNPEVLHLANDPLVVHHLTEDPSVRAAERGEALHLLVGDSNAGAEPVLLGALEPHSARILAQRTAPGSLDERPRKRSHLRPDRPPRVGRSRGTWGSSALASRLL